MGFVISSIIIYLSNLSLFANLKVYVCADTYICKLLSQNFDNDMKSYEHIKGSLLLDLKIMKFSLRSTSMICFDGML